MEGEMAVFHLCHLSSAIARTFSYVVYFTYGSYCIICCLLYRNHIVSKISSHYVNRKLMSDWTVSLNFDC